jgi:plasmid stability protein
VAQLIVRNLNDGIIRRLKLRAAQNGRSAEAEHREILKAMLMAPRSMKSLKDLLLSMPDAGEDADFDAFAPGASAPDGREAGR